GVQTCALPISMGPPPPILTVDEHPQPNTIRAAPPPGNRRPKELTTGRGKRPSSSPETLARPKPLPPPPAAAAAPYVFRAVPRGHEPRGPRPLDRGRRRPRLPGNRSRVPRPIRGTHHLPARGFANVPPLGGHLSPRAPGRHRDGRRPLLAPSRRRSHRHRPGGPFLLAQRRHAARGQHHYPAIGQKFVPYPGAHLLPEAAGGVSRPRPGNALLQETTAGALLEPGIFRQRRLRHRSRGPPLFQQRGGRVGFGRSGAAGGPFARPEPLLPFPRRGHRTAAAPPRAGADGPPWGHH